MAFRTRFSPPVDTGLVCEGGLTDQAPMEECDLNEILKKYRVGGIPPVDMSQLQYTDLTERPVDLLDAFERLNAAQEHFDSLPSYVREKFGNDFLQAIALAQSDPDKAVELGLAGMPPADSLIESASKRATPTGPADQAKIEVSPKGVEKAVAE